MPSLRIHGLYWRLRIEETASIVSLRSAMNPLWKGLLVRFDEAAKFVQALLEAADSGQIALERIDEERFRSAWLLRKIYRDKQDVSFTDLSSFVVMKELGITKAFTGDIHYEQVGFGFEIMPKR